MEKFKPHPDSLRRIMDERLPNFTRGRSIQQHYAPATLVEAVINKLAGVAELNGRPVKRVLVLFNPEFLFAMSVSLYNRKQTADLHFYSDVPLGDPKLAELLDTVNKVPGLTVKHIPADSDGDGVLDATKDNQPDFPWAEGWEEAGLKYDMVIGNPPYQVSSGSGSPIWQYFVDLATRVTEDRGLVSLIHPANWRSANGGRVEQARAALTGGHFHYLSIHGKNDGLSTFGATTRYDWYVWEKGAPRRTSRVSFEGSDEFELYRFPNDLVVPNFMGSLWTQLEGARGPRMSAFNCDQTLKPHKGNVSKVRKPGWDVPVLHSIQGKGPVVYWTDGNTESAYGGICIPVGDYPYAITVPDTVAVGPEVNRCPTGSPEESAAICCFLRSKVGWAISRSTKWSSYRTEYPVFERLPNPLSLGLTGESTDDEIYAALELDDKTIAAIEELAVKRPDSVANNTQEQQLLAELAEYV